ncbi:vacuolar protein sorting-associated protein 70 [Ephemerocybe angulata]|uniref:Vacuolar protein sorting-associated protein 70 n=1 Tax=Ephemerocybe angulata TaxID=980116 RepID=A0A8H6IE93_9AGAR|nr:vacuolar protein sorting-associated protein 70 [Tulosesus angulatus]
MDKLKGEIPVPATNPPTKTRQPSWKRYACFVAGALLLVSLYPYNSHPPRRRPHPPRPLPAEKAEELFLTVPDAESALAASRAYATHPHLAGSTEDFDDAKTILKLFQEELGVRPPKEDPIFPAGSHRSRISTLGLTSHFAPRHPTAWIDTYYPVLNTPLERTLQLLDKDNNVVFDADLVEDGDPLDPEAAKYKDAVPAWHGLSFDGTATGQFVYANYGTQEDYAELIGKGVNLTDKIVLARYGGIFRGLKVRRLTLTQIKGAEELGAAGVLIYSDPRDDGYVTEDNGYETYPQGPARNPSSVQRGSVQYLSLYPGDPTTPGYPSYENAERQEGINIPKIPSLPISWENAQPLLAELGDKKYPSFDGKVSKKVIKLENHVDTKVTPIWNAMAAIPGHIKDEVVLIGCHRDAWVMGAADPTSGTVSLHEIVRGFGTLLKQGWKPLRTIVIASWDAEEYGLVGSTEWGEDFHPWISKHVVSYLNVDVSVSGSTWNVGGSPSLADLIKNAALDVPHPTKPELTLWDARNDEGPFSGNTSKLLEDEPAYYGTGAMISNAPDAEIFPLGSGSDYTVFLQRIGVASTDQGFGSKGKDAVYHYHSVYDSQRWQEVYADPTFERHVAVAKHLGLLALRLTDSIILPLNTTRYAFELDKYLDRVESLLPSANLPASETPDFSGLRKSIKSLQEASLELDEEKVEAERNFRELLGKLPHGPPHGPPPHDGPEPPHGPPHGGPERPHLRRHHCHGSRSVFGRIKRTYYKLQNTVRSFFGLPPLFRHPRGIQRAHSVGEALGFALAVEGGDEHRPDHPPPPPDHPGRHHPPHHPPPPPRHPHPHFPFFKFIKAARRVARANRKLRSFEGGFISDEGIKDREWYKHLGVAPGKWLGYGATTFPALTEAITIEKNSTQIVYEAERLQTLIDALAKSIQPRCHKNHGDEEEE